MRTLSIVYSTIVYLCFRQALGHPAGLIRFSNVSTWMQFDASLQLRKWTDGRDVRAAVCTAGHQPPSGSLRKNGDCCSISDYIPINPSVGYEFSIYIKSTRMSMENSFGFFVYNKNKERIINDNLNDPYFKESNHDLDVWKKWTGYILPHYIPDNDHNSQPDSQSDYTNGVDWKWPHEASYVTLRFGSCNASEDSRRGSTASSPPESSTASSPPESSTAPPTPGRSVAPPTPGSSIAPFPPESSAAPPTPGSSIAPLPPESSAAPPTPGSSIAPLPPGSSVAPPTPGSSIAPLPPESITELPTTSFDSLPDTSGSGDVSSSVTNEDLEAESLAKRDLAEVLPTDEQIANETMYMFPNVQEIELQPEEDLEEVVTYDLTKPEEWQSKPQYVGKLSINGQHTPIARIVETDWNNTCYYPWGNTHIFKIDPDKTYEFSIWMSSLGTDLHNFLGFRAYDKDYNLLDFQLNETEVTMYFSNVTNKPYFKRSRNDAQTWTRWNGFVLPARNDLYDDIPLYFTKGRNWIWPRGSAYAQLRFGTCYGNGDKKGITYFALPQVAKSDLPRNS